MPILSLRRLGKRFGAIDVLRDISIDVHPGDFLVVLGRSGCGKSTLLRMIAGLEQPSEGDVVFDGGIVSRPGPERGLVFQSFALFPWLTARGNILFGLRRQVLPRGGRDRRVGELLDLARLGDRADLYPYQLSGGEQQRVAIARCLAAEPRVVLMDEPFGSLDAFTREELQAEIIRLWSKLGTTIIFVTHDIREAIFLGRRIVILGGRPASVVESIRTRDWIGPRAQGAACIDGCGDAPDVHTLSGELPDEDRVAHATRDPSIRYTTGFVRLEQHLSDRLRARAGDAC